MLDHQKYGRGVCLSIHVFKIICDTFLFVNIYKVLLYGVKPANMPQIDLAYKIITDFFDDFTVVSVAY